MDSNHRFSLQRERAIHYTKSINKNLLTEKRVSDSNGCLIPWDGSILTTKLTRLYIIIVNIFFVAPAWLEHAQPQGSKVFKTFLYTSSNMEPFYLFIYLFIYLFNSTGERIWTSMSITSLVSKTSASCQFRHTRIKDIIYNAFLQIYLLLFQLYLIKLLHMFSLKFIYRDAWGNRTLIHFLSENQIA